MLCTQPEYTKIYRKNIELGLEFGKKSQTFMKYLEITGFCIIYFFSDFF